uniref:Sushi domain-containing protein n=1 Tax=Ciona savignyi TaxID=51511 RepID=H2Z1V3_CIOSA
RWSFPPPSCNPVPCGRPPSILHGSHNLQNGSPSDFTFRKQVVYSCDDGYEFTLVSNPTLTCQSNREWDPIAPQCTPVSCGEPAAIENGNFEGFFTFGSTVQYACDRGYELEVCYNMIGAATLTCTYDGTFDLPSPNCVPVSCGPPLTPVNGRIRNQTGMILNDTFVYECDVGYEQMEGTEMFAECRENAEWSIQPPLCDRISCWSPLQIMDGTFQVTEPPLYGDVLMYNCNPGTLILTNLTKCSGTRTWVANVMSPCSPVKCPTPEVENSVVMQTGTVFQSLVSFTCVQGFSMVGYETSFCSSSATWAPELPICVPAPCNPPPSVANAKKCYRVVPVSVVDVLEFVCSPGYYMVGEGSVHCTADGLFSNLPFCLPVSCGEPPLLPNTILNYITGTHYGDNATYFCLPGYMLSGTTTSTCEASGNWSQVCPVCSPVSCGEPDVIENGYHTAQGNYTYGEAVTFSCNRGFRLVGMSFALCNAEAQWSSSSPTCHRKSCGPAPSIPNSIFQPAELLFEDQVIYECQFGYNMVGPSHSRCTANATWTSAPTCEPVVCGTAPMVEHGSVVGRFILSPFLDSLQ